MIPLDTPVYTSVKITEGDHTGRAGKVVGTDRETNSIEVELDPTAELSEERLFIEPEHGELLR